MNKGIEMELLIDTIRNSGNRVRNVLLVLSVASILGMSGIWNSLHNSWVNSHLKTYKVLINEIQTCKSMTHKQAESKPSRIGKLHEYFSLNGERKSIVNCKDNSKENIKMLDSMIGSLMNEIKQYKTIRAQHQLFTVIPVLGISIDNNDLAFFSGLSFCLILIWLRHALAAEGRALKIYFSKSDVFDQKDLFDLASAQQVFITPKLDDTLINKLFTKSSMYLMLIPLLVHIIIVINFLLTLKFGLFINRYTAIFNIISGVVFIFFLLRLFFASKNKLGEIEQIWHKQWLLVNNVNNH